MSTGKRIIKPYVLLDNQDASASFQSTPTIIENLDRSTLAIYCTGAPVGTITVQTSADYVPSSVSPTNAVQPLLAPTWFDMPLSLVALAGAPQNYFIDITQTANRTVRISFVAGVGSVGNVTAVVTAKES